jgi:hypothetical protein
LRPTPEDNLMIRPMLFTFAVGATIALAGAGCRSAAPSGAAIASAQAEVPDAPRGEAVADPSLREARDQADAMLAGLLAGRFSDDPNLSPVARRVKGYQSYSIQSQEMVRDSAAEFRGLLHGPVGRTRFGMTLMKQTDGKWAIGAFSGPNSD